MRVSDLAGPEAIIPSLKASSKKQALQELASFAAKLTGKDERTICDVLMKRERLGTTGVGRFQIEVFFLIRSGGAKR